MEAFFVGAISNPATPLNRPSPLGPCSQGDVSAI